MLPERPGAKGEDLTRLYKPLNPLWTTLICWIIYNP